MLTESTQLPAKQLAQGFADHVARWAQELNAPGGLIGTIKNAAYEASLATSEGHACAITGDLLPANSEASREAELREQLLASGVVGTPDNPGAMPLILDGDGRIYLHRYFDYEQRLAERLLADRAEPVSSDASLRELLTQLFPAGNVSSPDWQKLAVSLALHNKLTIISGGPGTGKTTSVVNLLACLLAQNPDCRIALTAPTGKAAARMQEAIRQHTSALPEALQARMPTESYTVHRLLGVSSRSGTFRHHAGNLLPIDVLIVDEASMLDLSLATQLLEAVPPQARIILLGDKDQLSAVEAGAVFSEISADPALSDECAAALSQLSGVPAPQISPPSPRKESPLQDSVIWLTESYRFSAQSAIGTLASAISQGDVEGAMRCLQSNEDTALVWLNDETRSLQASTKEVMHDAYEAYRQQLLSGSENKEAIFTAFDHFRILCAMREGPRGAEAINRGLNEHFRRELGYGHTSSEWYPGRPVIVLRNDYLLQLFNGDIGIALRNENGDLMVYFPDNANGYRAIAPTRLPEHETAFAMTVHKAQGSEFDRVMLLLPAQHHRVVSRELLYTGITRARKQAILIGGEETICKAVSTPSQRHSGLIRRLEEAIQT